MANYSKATLKKEFGDLLVGYSFGAKYPFVCKTFSKEAILVFNGIDTSGDTTNLAIVLKTAINKQWPGQKLDFVKSLSSMQASGAFKLVFENDDFMFYVNAGANDKITDCDFPVEIKFEPRSSCICC